MSDLLRHYVFLRKDLPSGVKLAQTVHAAGESVRFPIVSGTYAYVIEVDDERALLDLSQKFTAEGVQHRLIMEPDEPYCGQAMAIGCEPTRDRTKIRRLTTHLRLAR
jgi:peptidyl-tRNA hydrolase